MPASSTYQSQRRLRQAILLTAAPLLLAAYGWSQSQIPAPAPTTQMPAVHPAPTLPPAQPTQSQPPASIHAAAAPAPRAYRARIEFAQNRLTVAAENSSLNEILGEIAQLTGMKITGGVTDERVYGSYGPDSAQVVLNELLDGTGTNVMLLETPRHTVAELVLTPRNGGPTPPSPSAARDADRNEENLPPDLGGRRRELPVGRRDHIEGDPGQVNRSPEQPQTAPPQPGQPTQPVQPPPANSDNNNTAQPDASQPSPNGVKTPQQIYDELVKQQAQQQAPPQ